MKQLTKPGGVYLGVGLEQTFTYMWALQSKIGFIIDVRRQNMLTIVLHKALFEMSPDRADFLANLFSRRRPAGLDANTSAKALMTAFTDAPSQGLQRNIEAVKGVLPKHGYMLSAEDVARISLIQETFNRGGRSEVRNVATRTYQAIVLRSCMGCSASRVASAAVNVVVVNDVTNVRLEFIAQ